MPVNSFENYPMSWKPVLQKGNKPLYLALVNQLEADIVKGLLKPGTKLPPQRELADFLDINVSTVSRAFKICTKKGLLTGTIGRGTFVTYDVSTNILSLPHSPEAQVIPLGSMTPETIKQDEVIELLKKMMAENDFSSFFQYHNIPAWYRDAAVSLLARAGCKTSKECIMTANGGQNAIACIFSGLFQPGDRIGTDPFTYPGLKSAAKLFGIQLVPIAQENGEMSEEGLRYAIKNHNIKGIYVMPDYHNPTTHTMSDPGREMIAAVAKEKDILVIEDGINSLLQERSRTAIASLAPEQTVYIFSFSKTIIPSLRLSYLAVPERWRKPLENALYNINMSQSAFLTELAARLIVSESLDSLLKRRREGLRLRNRLTDQVLQEFTVLGDSQSLSRWLILPENMTGQEFEQMALRHGVLVYGSERFAVGKEIPVAAARLAICAPDSLDELEKGLNIIKALLNK